MRTVTTGAHNIHQMFFVGYFHFGGKLTHDLGRRGNFANRFFLHAQAGNQRGHHDRRHIARHDLAHQMQHLVMENLAVLDGALQGFLWRNFVGDGWNG